jgi:hypothetical protein
MDALLLYYSYVIDFVAFLFMVCLLLICSWYACYLFVHGMLATYLFVYPAWNSCLLSAFSVEGIVGEVGLRKLRPPSARAGTLGLLTASVWRDNPSLHRTLMKH